MVVEFTDFDIEVCQSCVNFCHIVDVVDLENRWDEIADWFIRMDFIPADWYCDLHYLLGKCVVKHYEEKN